MTDEIRRTPSTVECRAGHHRIGGYALQYNSRSRPMGRFVEQVAPSFIDRAKSQAYRGIICRYSHRDEYLLGSVDNRTLTLTDDPRGLQYTVEVPSYHGWVYDSVKRGDLRSSSFSFNITPDGDDWSFEDGMPLRTLLSADILEVGPCPIGAYESADVGLRSLASFVDAPYADVESRAASGQLATFFTRSDKTMSGRMALLRTLEMEQPRQTLTGSQAKLVLTQMANPERIM